MVEIISVIPEFVGWLMVGTIAVIITIMAAKLGKLFIEMWKERKAEKDQSKGVRIDAFFYCVIQTSDV